MFCKIEDVEKLISLILILTEFQRNFGTNSDT